jgi:hypothetical protein
MKLQQVIESQTKAKSKITWRRQVSDPLGKGNGSTHPRQRLSSRKERKPPKQSSNNHKELPLHTCKLPLNQCTFPWMNACKPLENRATATLSAHTGQTGHHHQLDRCLRCAQDQHSHRSDRCTTEPRNGSKPPENLLNASSKPFQAQTSPPCWQCMNQAKNAKLST